MADRATRDPARTAPDAGARSAGSALAWCLLGGVGASLLPLPWSLAAGLFYVAAAVAGVVALVRLVRPDHVSRAAVTMVAAGTALAVLMVLGSLVRLLFYPVFSEADTCTRTALTERGRAACEELVRDRFDDLVPGTR